MKVKCSALNTGGQGGMPGGGGLRGRQGAREQGRQTWGTAQGGRQNHIPPTFCSPCIHLSLQFCAPSTHLELTFHPPSSTLPPTPQSLSWYLALPCVLLVAAGWFCSVALAVSMAERAAGGGGGGGRRSWRGHGEQAAKGRHEVPEGASGEGVYGRGGGGFEEGHVKQASKGKHEVPEEASGESVYRVGG